MIRLVALVAAGTRSVIDAVFGTDAVGELSCASRLATALRPGMLLLGDRNFAACGFLATVTGAGADFVIRAKTGATAMKLPVLSALPDGSYLSIAGGVRVRVIDAMLTITTATQTRTGHDRLLTTILDPADAPAEALLRLYHERWEIESAYCELKSSLLGGRVLRGKHPTAVRQETWALLAAYQTLRTAMADAVLTQPELDPDRASFTIALATARDQIVHAAGIIATSIDLLGRIGTAVLADLLPRRGIRTSTRAIKRAISKYRGKPSAS